MICRSVDQLLPSCSPERCGGYSNKKRKKFAIAHASLLTRLSRGLLVFCRLLTFGLSGYQAGPRDPLESWPTRSPYHVGILYTNSPGLCSFLLQNAICPAISQNIYKVGLLCIDLRIYYLWSVLLTTSIRYNWKSVNEKSFSETLCSTTIDRKASPILSSVPQDCCKLHPVEGDDSLVCPLLDLGWSLTVGFCKLDGGKLIARRLFKVIYADVSTYPLTYDVYRFN